MNRDNIELDVVVKGSPLKEYGNRGDTYVEAREGTEYALRVRNHYSHRVLVVPSVDGLNPLNGRSTVNNEEGYVVPAYGSILIDGWRTSLSDVNKFVFDRKRNSYSAKTGTGTCNCGVIGIQVFKEKIEEGKYYPVYYPQPYYVYPTYPQPWYIHTWPNTIWNNGPTCVNGICSSISSDTNTTFTGYVAPQASNENSGLRGSSSGESVMSCQNQQSVSELTADSLYYDALLTNDSPHQLGTGWGENKESLVSQTTFTKGDLLQTLTIYYADRQGLLDLGIDLSKSIKVAFTKPMAFGGFCQPPDNSDC